MPRPPSSDLPAPVIDRLRQVGAAVRAARLRRRWSQRRLAGMAGISAMTIRNAEAGRPGVTLATYAVLLWAMNLDHLLDPLVDPAADREGLTLEAARRGHRIRERRDLDDDF